VNRIDSKTHRNIVSGLLLGALAVTASACGSSSTPSTSPTTSAAAQPKTVNIELVGKIDTNTGPAGTFTSKEHWPAMAPSDLKFAKGDNVVLTIKEYDDAPTALPAGSPYNAVQGGTMTVDGKATTTVANADIAHTFSIPELNINVPLSKAPEGKFSTTVFTFKVDKSGAYTWHCFTPCGGDPNGVGGSMATKGWMEGNVVVA
jgi:hypothetical protein